MTIKMLCSKIERIWGGTANYHFTSVGGTSATLVVSISEDDPRRFTLGEHYEITLK